MHNKKKFLIFSIIVLFVFTVDNMAVYVRKEMQTKLKSGSYSPTDAIRYQKLRAMPVPSSNENYAIYQSIDKVTSIVLGKFQSSEDEIHLIQDTNSDGKVDNTYIYDVRKRQVKKLKLEISDEEFKKLKDGIFFGNLPEIGPNKEGIDYVKSLVKSNSELVKVTKYKRGFQILEFDPDEITQYRIKFIYSTDIEGANLAFEVLFHNIGQSRVQPIIPISVFAQNSKDKYVQAVVDELSKYTSEYIIIE
ncbi:MAG: hypothetical protein JW982_10595 [Spirochaetes bacterium]|nr:hypothetical protein [Spirochaetota bacterium]